MVNKDALEILVGTSRYIGKLEVFYSSVFLFEQPVPLIPWPFSLPILTFKPSIIIFLFISGSSPKNCYEPIFAILIFYGKIISAILNIFVNVEPTELSLDWA